MSPDEVAHVRAASDNAWMDTLHEETWVTSRMKLIGVLWRHQRETCAICGRPMHHRSLMKGANRLSIDHVFPKSRRGMFRRGIVNEKTVRRKGFNYVCAHGKCNSDKGSRAPTGCELIWLLAVNARRGYDPLGWRHRKQGMPGRSLLQAPLIRDKLVAEGLIR